MTFSFSRFFFSAKYIHNRRNISHSINGFSLFFFFRKGGKVLKCYRLFLAILLADNLIVCWTTVQMDGWMKQAKKANDKKKQQTKDGWRSWRSKRQWRERMERKNFYGWSWTKQFLATIYHPESVCPTCWSRSPHHLDR